MPVKKFKTFEDAEMDLWEFHPDKEWIRHALILFQLSVFKGKCKPVKRGITKFRSFEEAEKGDGE